MVVLGNFFLEEHDRVFRGKVSWCLHLSNGSTGRKVSMVAKSLQSCSTLCTPMDRNLPSSSAHVFLQARILEQVVMPSSRGLSDPGIESVSLLSPALGDGFFITSANWEAQKSSKCSRM